MIDNFIELLELYESIKQKKIIIFGTGESSRKVTKLIEYLSIKVAYYVDNDLCKQGEIFLESKIYPPNILYEENKFEIAIIVASMFYEDIAYQLKNMGFIEKVHFYYGMDASYYRKLDKKINKNSISNDLSQQFERIYHDNLNYVHSPLQVRKWIKLLEDDANTGIRIKKDLCLKEDYLGFTFCSNNLGLRGPNHIYGKGVIFGTSFAMGFAVNNGFNWYDDNIFAKDWLNLGLPVGSMEINNLYKECYKGDHSIALMLYYPNFWVFDKRYEGRVKTSLGLLQYMGWKTEYIHCLQLTIDKYNQFKLNIQKEKNILLEYNGDIYLLDGGYSFFNPSENVECFNNGLQNWIEILSDFKKVLIVSIPTKENIACKYVQNDYLDKLKKVNEKSWAYTKESLSKLHDVAFLEPDIFTLDDYYPCDSHWNEKGNNKFLQYIIDILNKYV